jgi:hypothetical protein
VTTTFQEGYEGYTGSSDTRISAEAPASNFGASDLRSGARQQIATLLRFDVSSIPSGANVQSAYLHVYGYLQEGSTNFDLGAFTVNRAWAEGEASWNMAMSSTPWGAPGCNDVFADRAHSAIDQATVGPVGSYTWAVTDDVQRMVDYPETNAGWVLMQTGAVPGVVSMYSSEHANAAHRPKLVVTYTLP